MNEKPTMTENDVTEGHREKMLNLFLSAIEKCPGALKADIGAEKLADEIVKGAKVLTKYLYKIE
jgi:hypothetical protein